MLIESRDISAMNLAEVWFSCNDMDSSYRSDTVYAIHCSGELNYPYFRSLVEYNTFEPNSLCTSKSCNKPENRYIGESTTIKSVSLSKVIFPAFLRKQGYRYAYIYDAPQLDNPNWYGTIHTGATACKNNWIYKLFDDDVSNPDYDIVVQFSSTLDESVCTRDIVTCIHTSNFSQPHLSQVTRVGTQENYGNVLSVNSFLTLAGTMNGFISGNMLVAEDFSMRYIGDQLLLAKPAGLQVYFYYDGFSTLIENGTCTSVPLPGNAGCYTATISPTNATSLEVNPYVTYITVKENMEDVSYPYIPGYPYYGCIAINCKKNNTEFTFMVTGGIIPVSIQVEFQSVRDASLVRTGVLCFCTQPIEVYCWQPGNKVRLIKAYNTDDLVTTGYTLFYPNVDTNLLTYSAVPNNEADIIISPETASCKELKWRFDENNGDNVCIMGGVVEQNESVENCEKTFLWTGVFEDTIPYVYAGCYSVTPTEDPEGSTVYHVWENKSNTYAGSSTSYLYSCTNCFKDTINLYCDSCLTIQGPTGYARNAAFIPQVLDDETWAEHLRDCTNENGYIECLCGVQALPLSCPDACWVDICSCDLCFTYAPESIEVDKTDMSCIGKDADNNNICGYILSEFWPGTKFNFCWKTTPTIQTNSGIYSLTHCSERKMNISLCSGCCLKVTGIIQGTEDISDYTDQHATYHLIGDITGETQDQVIENGEWSQFKNCSCWSNAGLGIGVINMGLCDNDNITEKVYFTTNNTTKFYYASLQVETTDGTNLPDEENPYLLSDSTLKLAIDGVGQHLRIKACPGGSSSDIIDYTTNCSDLIAVCYYDDGQTNPYWCKNESPNFAPSVSSPELVPTVCLGIKSKCHSDIYSQCFVVRPVYSVSSMSLKNSAMINGHEVTLCSGYFDGTSIYPDSQGGSEDTVQYLSIIKPLEDPVKVIIDGVEQDGWEIGPFIQYFPVYASHADTDLTFTEDQTLQLPQGLNLVTRSGHGYITIDVNNFEYGTSRINISLAGSQTITLPFYINVTGNGVNS